MSKFVGSLVLAACLVALAGYYMGWFHFSASGDNGLLKVNMSADRQEIREDLKEAGNTLIGSEEKNRPAPRSP